MISKGITPPAPPLLLTPAMDQFCVVPCLMCPPGATGRGLHTAASWKASVLQAGQRARSQEVRLEFASTQHFACFYSNTN